MDYGSRLLAGHRMQPRRATSSAACATAGFVIVGTTKTPEFGILPTTEPRHVGPARNPWDPRAHARRLLRRRGGGGRRRRCCRSPTATTAAARSASPPPAAASSASSRAAGASPAGPDSGDSFLVCDGVLTRTVLDTRRRARRARRLRGGDATWAPPPGAPFVRAVSRDAGRAADRRRPRSTRSARRRTPEALAAVRDDRGSARRPRPPRRGGRRRAARRRRRCRSS